MPLLLALALLLLGAPSHVGAVIDLQAETSLAADGTTLRLTATNRGPDAARDVRPQVHHQNRTHDPEPLATLAAGTSHTWTVTLPPPAEPGTVPVIVDVAYTDAGDAMRTTPLVATVSSAGFPPSDVELMLAVTPVGRHGRATIVLHNRGTAPIHGRVVVALPGDVTTEPVSQAADVPPGERVTVPLVLQRRGPLREASLPAYAFFDYGLEGRRHVVLAAGTVTLEPPAGPVSPVIVGATALAVAFAVLGVALRAAARRRPPAPAERASSA